MTALEHLVLESVRRLDAADADQIRSNVSELMGSQISRGTGFGCFEGLAGQGTACLHGFIGGKP